jgi:uncharacterized protein
MRDGVELLTDVYVPVGQSLGTLLIRTPYGRAGLQALLTARYFATHGYHVVNQSLPRHVRLRRGLRALRSGHR